MRYAIALGACAALLTACGSTNRSIAKLTGSTEVCIDGVRYLQFPTGASVKYTREGRIATC